MSERLEEIDQIVEDLYNDKIELRGFVQESLEQAERVQELEDREKRLRKHIFEARNDVVSQSKLLRESEQQNKRYREAIKKAETTLMDERCPLDFNVSRAMDILVEALEESE